MEKIVICFGSVYKMTEEQFNLMLELFNSGQQVFLGNFGERVDPKNVFDFGAYQNEVRKY